MAKTSIFQMHENRIAASEIISPHMPHIKISSTHQRACICTFKTFSPFWPLLMWVSSTRDGWSFQLAVLFYNMVNQNDVRTCAMRMRFFRKQTSKLKLLISFRVQWSPTYSISTVMVSTYTMFLHIMPKWVEVLLVEYVCSLSTYANFV